MAEQRAYLTVSAVAFIGPDTDPMTVKSYRVTIRNTGTTPALDIQPSLLVTVGSLPSGKYELERPIAVDPPATVIASGSEMHLMTRALGTIPEGLDALILAGKQAVYLHGFIRYRDVSGDTHTTRFRYARSADSHAMVACDNGNDAD